MRSSNMGNSNMTGIDRRSFLKLGAAGAGMAALGTTAAACAPDPSPPSTAFSAGIAAGLHSPSEVVIWTRVDPGFDPSTSTAGWEVGTSPAMTTIVSSGNVSLTTANDSTVKVLVGGLAPDSNYWYRFTAGTETSQVGRARTLPSPGAAVGSLKLAYASCQAYGSGYYAAWRQIATTELDAVMFLGDYIYEDARILALGSARPENVADAFDLGTYRAKYRLYKSDPDLQAAHAAHPFTYTWDDHEIVNDYDSTIFTTNPGRAAGAYQAWFEYQPVWPITGTQIYRSLRWGALGEIFMIDTRQYRDPHRDGAPLIGARVITDYETNPTRSMLGTTQRAWLLDGLADAQTDGVVWKIIGNPSMIAPIRIRDDDTPAARLADPSLPLHAGEYTNSNFDSWDGFPAERDAVLGHLSTAGVENTIFVTGDYHSFWAAALTTDFDDPSAPVVAHDFAAGAISSGGGAFNENILSGGSGSIFTSPAFDYVDLFRNGYGTIEATPGSMEVTFHAHQAAYKNVLPTPAVRFSLTPGDTTAVKTLL